jgi:hypothetical protein
VTPSPISLVKGLEFRAVGVRACNDGFRQLVERIADAADDAELDNTYETERCLLYVACTQAREHLLLTGVTLTSVYLADLTGLGRLGRLPVAHPPTAPGPGCDIDDESRSTLFCERSAYHYGAGRHRAPALTMPAVGPGLALRSPRLLKIVAEHLRRVGMGDGPAAIKVVMPERPEPADQVRPQDRLAANVREHRLLEVAGVLVAGCGRYGLSADDELAGMRIEERERGQVHRGRNSL